VQLVLGAGAMQVSGLKSISAKHLALANQAVCVVLALLPSVSVCLGALLPVRQLCPVKSPPSHYSHRIPPTTRICSFIGLLSM
jgi:hypothetical protein